VKLGAHLPLADLGDGHPTAADLREYAAGAQDLGFTTLSANDHLLWRRPWLDGLTALGCVLGSIRDMAVATSIALPVVRHPVVLAKALATLAILADGPVVAGLGPGSSREDYAAAGVPFEQRWARFDEAVPLVRALVRGELAEDGAFYAAPKVRLEPVPHRLPQVWCGSWGSGRRLRRMAAVADGWFASGYNTTPTQYAEARALLDDHLRAVGRAPARFPDAVATMWFYVTGHPQEADHLLTDVLAPVLDRDPDQLAGQLPVGSPDHCIRVLSRYAEAGAREVLVWPVRDALAQLEICAGEVMPHLPASRPTR
jgi:alkanesulfonate monooxygenase SsuD/methylene tetrahydromethanopterin reductase-like flavin-dependent oxidoreductase (luciferase family)